MLQRAVDALLVPIDVPVRQAEGHALAEADHALSPARRDALAEGVVSGEDPRHFVLEQALALVLTYSRKLGDI